MCHRLTVNTGKFMVYCRSLTRLSPLGKPRLTSIISYQSAVPTRISQLLDILTMKVTKVTSQISIQHKKIYILKTYKLKKQKRLI